MINCAIQRGIFVGVMSQKRITSYFKQPGSSKRKLSNLANEVERECKMIASTQMVSYPLIKREQDSSSADSHLSIDFMVGTTWVEALQKEFDADYFKKLCDFLIREMSHYSIFPPTHDIFSWTTSVPIDDIKVVILGQDPYIRPEQAHGLAFSVRKGVEIPKSLINMYGELAKDIKGFVRPTHGCLNGWADQGVLLLNTCLTVRAGHSNSHKGQGWELFTDAVIKWINANLKNVVFMLWGNNAQEKSKLISKDNHLILCAPHPSPLSASRGFFGCRHFSKANTYLQEHNRQGINWKYLP